MRFPSLALSTVYNSQIVEFISTYSNTIINSTSSNLPPFFQIFAKLLIKQTPFGSILDHLNKNKK